VSDLKLAPFHLLATDRRVHVDKPHDWHMQTLARLAGGIIVATPFHVIDVTSPESEAKGIACGRTSVSPDFLQVYDNTYSVVH
jgi:protein phosphatase